MTSIVKLNVKSPSSGEDRELTATLDSTVLSVKKQIESDWPHHPPPEDQRLVYAGKLLENQSVLRQVLRLSDAKDANDAFTIHLVCRMASPPPPAPKRSLRKMVSTRPSANGLYDPLVRRRHPANSERVPSPPPLQCLEEVSPPVEEGPSQQNDSIANNNPWAQYYQANNQSPNDQALMMQQMYTNYMGQYMQYLQSVGMMPHPSGWAAGGANVHSEIQNGDDQAAEARAAAAPPVLDPVAAAAAAAAVAGANNVHARGGAVAVARNAQEQQGRQPVAAAAAGAAADGVNVPPNVAANVVMNAGAGGIGAMEDEDEVGGQRDVLDWFYVASRVLVLFSIVYFYSSLARFALVAGLGVVIYLYQMGFFRAPRDNNNPQQQPENNNQGRNQNQDRNEENNGAAAATVEEEEATAVEEPPAASEVEVEIQPNFFEVVSTFVSTFFSSLIPQAPQVV